MAQTSWYIIRTGLFAILLTVCAGLWPIAAAAETAVDFPGTVLASDQAAGKLTVKKAEGGTRFTFAVTDKTAFGGSAKTFADVKKGDGVTVTYVVTGSQYLAQKVVKK
jgi:hypothetical protein